MKIPSQFKKAISEMFYDKAIAIKEVVKGKPNDEGGRGKDTLKDKFELKCNPQPTSLEQVKEFYGINIDASLKLTCKVLETDLKGYFFTYKDENYEVVENLTFDSHSVVFAKIKKWN